MVTGVTIKLIRICLPNNNNNKKSDWKLLCGL